MSLMTYSSDDIKAALSALRSGGVILYPTDTIWGIGCDATDEAAVRRVYEIKRRDDSKALILLTDSVESLRRYVPSDCLTDEVLSVVAPCDEMAQSRPVTVIYPRVSNLPASLLAADGSVAIRITREAFSRDLCAALGRPLVSTSANRSGQPAAQCFAQIDMQIADAVDYVCRYRQDDATPALPSMILRLNMDPQGNVSFATIRK